MALNGTNFGFALKNQWPQARIAEISYTDHPFFAMVKKNEKVGGDQINLATKYGDTQGRSATFATAQANKGNIAGVKFALTTANDYALISVTNKVIEQSRGNDAALLRAADAEMESAYQILTKSQAQKCYGDGSGKIGQVGSVSGGVITLKAPTSDVVNFEVGQKIVASATLSGGSLRSGTGTVTAVDRGDTPTVTYSGTITSIAANDYLYTEGDYDGAMKGLAAWLPTSAPGATAFFGVDRSVDTNRLGGIRYDGSGSTIQDALIKAASRAGREGASLDYGFMNFEDWANLELELGSKVQYDYPTVKAGDVTIGFTGIKVNGFKKPFTVLPDMDCPKTLAYLLTMPAWTLFSHGKVPHISNFDGNDWLRETSSDGFEARLVAYSQLGCDRPGHNVVVTLPS